MSRGGGLPPGLPPPLHPLCPGQAPGEMTLVFGCRSSRHDNIYKDELQEAQQQGALSHVLIGFSRDPAHPKVTEVEGKAEARGGLQGLLWFIQAEQCRSRSHSVSWQWRRLWGPLPSCPREGV